MKPYYNHLLNVTSSERKVFALAQQLFDLYGQESTPQGVSILSHRASLALRDGVLTPKEYALLVNYQSPANLY